jgi:hypothetical protein
MPPKSYKYFLIFLFTLLSIGFAIAVEYNFNISRTANIWLSSLSTVDGDDITYAPADWGELIAFKGGELYSGSVEFRDSSGAVIRTAKYYKGCAYGDEYYYYPNGQIATRIEHPSEFDENWYFHGKVPALNIQIDIHPHRVGSDYSDYYDVKTYRYSLSNQELICQSVYGNSGGSLKFFKYFGTNNSSLTMEYDEKTNQYKIECSYPGGAIVNFYFDKDDDIIKEVDFDGDLKDHQAIVFEPSGAEIPVNRGGLLDKFSVWARLTAIPHLDSKQNVRYIEVDDGMTVINVY